VNPSATILAAAERSIETVIRRSGHPGWRAPEWESAVPTAVPEDTAFVSMSDLHASTKGGGVEFRERMATRGRKHPSVVVSLKAEIPSMDRFLADPEHTVSMRGVIDVEGLASRAELTGTLSLFPEGAREAMSYAMRFEDDQGRAWRLTGVKKVRARTPVALLTGLTHLRAEIAPVDAASGESRRFVLSIGDRDLVRLGTSITGRGFTRAGRLGTVTRFTSFFATSALRRRAPRPRNGSHADDRSGSRSAPHRSYPS
jgi:cholesterol oxidase